MTEVRDELLQSMREGKPFLQTGIPKKHVIQNDAIPESPPEWLKHDRQVLRFFAYFQESVVEDPNENFRYRKCVIYYYLEDGTIYISEPKIENSGLPQGVFLKRHKVPRKDGSGVITWEDFNCGEDIEIYA